MSEEAPPIRVAEDRSLVIPNGKIVRTAYVPVGQIDLSCKARMAIGDIEIAYRRRLNLGSAQPWPPAVGCWQGDRFCLLDGRHDYISALMLGVESILVAWIDDG